MYYCMIEFIASYHIFISESVKPPAPAVGNLFIFYIKKIDVKLLNNILKEVNIVSSCGS